jgi:threonine dehydratase
MFKRLLDQAIDYDLARRESRRDGSSVLDELTLDSVRAAAERIRRHVLRTPLLTHRAGDCELLLKPESLQTIGAFKIRGAFSLMTTLPDDCPGVVAHSSGNHAQAVARAGKVLGIRAVIVMPSDAPRLKRRRTEEDGAEIVTVGNDSDERAKRAGEIASREGLTPVPPYDDPLIAAGQGTAALELVEDAKALDRFYAPVSGGGLMAGCATVVRALCPRAEIVGVEPEDADDTKQSLERGERVRIAPPRTIADGLRVRIPGERTWPVLQAKVDRMETVSDREMLEAMAFALSELRLVLEPSGAASLALALRERKPGRNAILLSGGNVDPAVQAEALRLVAG